MAGKLVLCRHGQSEWNLKNLFTGWHDVDLTEKGVGEATEGVDIVMALDISSSMLAEDLEPNRLEAAKAMLPVGFSVYSTSVCRHLRSRPRKFHCRRPIHIMFSSLLLTPRPSPVNTPAQ